jgi:UDP:flavonoid glycosyltransferase YjiC (YdhE family)
LILWQEIDDQPLWGAAVERLKVGRARPFSAATLDSLVADLCSILTPECAARACKVAALMTPAAESVARAADLLEDGARPSPKGDVMRTPPPRLDRS